MVFKELTGSTLVKVGKQFFSSLKKPAQAGSEAIAEIGYFTFKDSPNQGVFLQTRLRDKPLTSDSQHIVHNDVPLTSEATALLTTQSIPNLVSQHLNMKHLSFHNYMNQPSTYARPTGGHHSCIRKSPINVLSHLQQELINQCK